jgi:hypothetical protein
MRSKAFFKRALALKWDEICAAASGMLFVVKIISK